MAHDNVIQQFLESGLLEQHALGLTSPAEADIVNDWLVRSGEVRAEWEAVQISLEQAAIADAVTPPSELGHSIRDQIRAGQKPPQAKKINLRRINRMIVAASVAAFVFLAAAISEWNRSESFKRENAQLKERVQELEQELNSQELKFAALESEMSVLQDPVAQKISLQADDLSLIAYWNETDRKSWLQVIEHPELPQSQCLQLWADVHGEMISLGVIPNQPGLIELDFKVDAESLNITIEPAGGSLSPTVSRLVASQTI